MAARLPPGAPSSFFTAQAPGRFPGKRICWPGKDTSPCLPRLNAGSAKGKPPDFGSGNQGSSPCPAARSTQCPVGLVVRTPPFQGGERRFEPDTGYSVPLVRGACRQAPAAWPGLPWGSGVAANMNGSNPFALGSNPGSPARSSCPVRPEAQDAALSRRKHRFDSGTGCSGPALRRLTRTQDGRCVRTAGRLRSAANPGGGLRGRPRTSRRTP